MLLERWSSAVALKQPAETEVRLRRFDGEYRWFRFGIHPAAQAIEPSVQWCSINTEIDDQERTAEAEKEDPQHLVSAAESDFRAIADSIPALIALMTPAGEVESVNRSAQEYYGATLEQLKGWATSDAVHPDDLPAVIRAWKQSVESGQPYDIEHRIRHADGSYRWFHVSGSPLRDSQGRVTRWCVLQTDVDDRKRAEEVLRSGERDLIRIINTIPTTAWSTRPDGYCDFLNQRRLEYAGLSADEARGWGWGTSIHPDDAKGLVEYWQSCLASGTPVDTEARMRRFDGQYRWFIFRANPLRDEAGNIVKWYGTNVDIEDRKRTDEALRESQRNLSLIINTIPVMAWAARPDGSAEFLNQQYLDYAGFSEDQAQGWGWTAAVHPDDLGGLATHWQSLMGAGRPGEYEARLRRFDGEYRWFLFRVSPLRDEAGNIVKWYGTNTDIEDRKQAESLLAGEKRLLEMVASGHALAGILEAICQLVEGTVSGCYCGVVLVDSSGMHLEQGAAPSLPASFLASILGRSVTVDSGPCAMAAFLNQQVVSADLNHETRWAGIGWCTMALSHELQACWAVPVASNSGKVLGAFAIYYKEPGMPAPLHQRLIEQFKHITSIAVERAQSDAALQRSEARKTAILDSALDCIVTIDQEGRVTEFNPAAERTFGYRRDETVGHLLGDIIVPPPLREKHRQGFARYLATGESKVPGKRVEMTAMRSDGSEFPVELAISRIPWEGPPSFTGYLRDISERKRAEEELRRSEAFLAQGQHLSRIGSFSWSIATAEIIWSKQLYRIFEFERRGLMTQRRLAEEALSKAQSELTHVDRVTSLGVLTASIAHEVNQPLAGMITNASTCLRMLASEPPNVEGARETARRTIRDGNRASDVVSRLRALFRKKDFATEAVDLNEAIREVIALSLGKLRGDRVLLQSELSEELPAVAGDRVQLQQVILNLLLNATDAMNSVEDRARLLVIKTEKDEGGCVRVSMRDTGVGLETQSMDKLFEAFYTTKAEGMGIGLSVSRSIIDSHGGRLWAAPNDGPGATFSFTIPCLAADAAGAAAGST